MKRLICGLGLALVSSMALSANKGDHSFATVLEPRQEVPAISSPAGGDAAVQIDQSATQISYAVSWRNLTSDALQAHMHTAQPDVNGGIMVWLCSNLASPPTPPATQPCPAGTSGRISGTLVPSDVVGPSGQGIAPGEMAEVIKAIREGFAYVNVHNAPFGSGEIRGQLAARRKKSE